ncbi:MAG TPA: DUF1302 domain-containing protein [Usitatibacter sp.]|nr:DUF1302 domain-containing protein [Usitatibacter sp.]
MQRPFNARRRALVAVVAAALAPSAHAINFDLDNGDQVIWTTTLSAGTSWRAENPDPRLLHPNNAILQGITGAVGGNTDDGDLNFKKGKQFSSPLKLVTDVEYKHGDFGAFVRGKAWYDATLENQGVQHGSFTNGYVPGARLDDSNYENLAKFSGVALMDAYAYGTFGLGGDSEAKVKVGRHVLNWGESLFIQGVNQINPIDVPALRRPGTEIKEVLLPVGMVSANVGLGRGVSAEGFYQYQWQDSVVDGCGTYFLAVDASVGPRTENACRAGFLQSLSAAQAAQLSALLHTTIAPGDQGGAQAGAYLPATDTHNGSSSGQYGLSVHVPVNSLDTEFGLYALQYSARLPVLSTIKGNSPFPLTTRLLGSAASQESAFWEYPDKVRLYGISASTDLLGWSVGAEASYSPNFPAQYAPGDLLAGLVYGSAPQALAVLGVSAPVAAAMNAYRGPLTAQFTAAQNGQIVSGYNRIGKTQLQVNAIQFFNNVAGAETLSVAGEVGMQRDSVPNFQDGVRYGRSFVFGIATAPSYGPLASAVAGGCPILNTPNQTGCENAGFVTRTSWGYRVRGQLSYSNVFDSGITAKPALFWGQDVNGVSADGQFNAGRGTLGLTMGFEYRKMYDLEFGYVTYSNSAKWDPLRDRDYYSASLSVTF